MDIRRAGASLAPACMIAGLLVADASLVSAQSQSQAPVDHSQHQHDPEQAADEQAGGAGSPLALPMGREGSGTAWLPDSTPMYAVHETRGPWQLMLHGNVFAQYLKDAAPRGREQFGSVNWFMAMARRPAGAGRLGINAMLSLEPWTIRGCGYPDLLATGEVCDGESIVDQQHPHDLFMELAASYDRPVTDSVAFQLYGGPAAEPALGPVAYPHRVSAMPNPLAPISHHWVDATHITFGVVTAGIYGRKWKVEGSVFNGREPDEDRRGFDLAPLDSVSGRIWFVPTAGLSMQFSAGHLEEAEPAHDDQRRVDVDRITASATYHRLLGGSGIWASTIAWGRNAEAGEASNFVLAESNLTLNDRDVLFGRVDVGGKAAHDLDVHGSDEIFTVAKLQGGYVRYFNASPGWKAGIGASVSLSLVPRGLESVYDGRATPGVGVFVALRPAGMIMAGSDPHAGHQAP
jgi:hypothetical protein